MRTLARAALALALFAASARPLVAQAPPNASWRTLRTAHFLVHFTPELEPIARRAAVSAETAWTRLAARLHPPRGPIDLVIADNVDYSNGFTTPFPTNRILVYAHPPLDVVALRFYEDWLALVITHELTHSFHLDRTRGWWRVAQFVFGRAPFLFPDSYAPGWVTEGLATYFESDLTGGGRVAGTYEPMVIDAYAEHDRLLPIDRWNLATTRYPGGDLAYGYGALFLDYLARTRGDARVRDFVERESGSPIPYFINRTAQHAFGISFRSAWHEWRDTLRATLPVPARPLAGWRDLTRAGPLAIFPRWLGDTALLIARDPWVATPGAYTLALDGRLRRLARRNTVDRQAPRPDGAIVFAQLDFVDRYHVRSDLYVARGGHTHRLTHGARIAEVDARTDGSIVAVRFTPGSTQLVRVSADGRTITPLSGAVADTEWAEPAWSPTGDRIAVTRWTRGGDADVVILDTLGRLERQLTHDRAFDASPSWTPDGRAVLFTSDRTGRTDVYRAAVDDSEPPVRLSRSTTGLFYPRVSPDGRTLAAARFDLDGWHVGVTPLAPVSIDTPAVVQPPDAPSLPPPLVDSAPAHRYSPWRTLWPRYWLPVIAQTTGGSYALGGLTSGQDVIGRHAIFAQALIDPRGVEHTIDATWQWSGLGQPIVTGSFSQYWDRFGVVDTLGSAVGDLLRRTRLYSLGVSITRPRIRTNAAASLVASLEQRAYRTSPSSLLGELDPFFSSGPAYWVLTAGAGWTSAQRPLLAISPEDGVALGVSGALRWPTGGGAFRTRDVIGSVSAYKSLALGGFAHHVVAARVAAGAASGSDPTEFDLGGASGERIAVIPGLVLGGTRIFAVRGFPVGVESGTRALTGSVEYRAPLAAPHRGFGFWPVFLDRLALSVFGDAGAAWRAPGFSDRADDWIASVGGELTANLGVQYDAPYLLRLGLGVPVLNRSPFQVSGAQLYVRLGYAF